MARSWTTETFAAGDQFKADHFNGEANAIAQQVNGELDQNNMPLLGCKSEQLLDPIRTYDEHGVNTVSSYMPTQSYHYQTFFVDNTASIVTSAITPTTIFITNFEVQGWDPFWNSIPTAGTPSMNQGQMIRFNAREGMIYGSAVISSERRAGRITYITDDGSFNINVGENETYELGVFVNGVLCARTGEIQIGAWCFDLPFTTPIGTEFCEIEVKWMASQDAMPNSKIPTAVITDHYRLFAIAGLSLWARNQYR